MPTQNNSMKADKQNALVCASSILCPIIEFLESEENQVRVVLLPALSKEGSQTCNVSIESSALPMSVVPCYKVRLSSQDCKVGTGENDFPPTTTLFVFGSCPIGVTFVSSFLLPTFKY